MEKKILGKFEWNLTVPTSYVFLVRFIKASILNEPDVENMAYFLAELGMMNYTTVTYCPSMVAASAVYGARCTLEKASFWNETQIAYQLFRASTNVDTFMDLWNKNDEFQVDYVRCNMKSTLRRFKTLDARSLGPVLPVYVGERESRQLNNPSTTNPYQLLPL